MNGCDRMIIELNKLISQEKKPFYFEYTDVMNNLLEQIENVYLRIPEYRNDILYCHNMIKTSISDIDIEQDEDTSYIESLSAICCKKIKNKNQRTAYNLLKLLETGILERQKYLTDEYVIKIWKALTSGNRNVVSIESGYRKLGVKLGKGGVLATKSNTVYIAPNAKEVPFLMNKLYSFINNDIINENSFYNAILKSIIFSAYFVYVHPFSDGNGRLSRLLTNKILVDNGLLKYKYVSINQGIIRDKKAYSLELLKIERSKNLDLTQYILFMLNLYYGILERIANPNRKKLDYASLSNREKIMLRCIQGSSQGVYVKQYKFFWNSIAKEHGYPLIKVKDAEKDLMHLFFLDFIVYDERYTLYPGFKYYNK